MSTFGLRARAVALCCFASSALFACTDVSSEPIGAATEAVISGAPDSLGAYDAVARMSSNCSGVLIAPRVVLTSQHCFVNHATGCTTLAMTPISVTFAEPTGGYASLASFQSRTVAVASIAVRQDAVFDIGSCPAPNLCGMPGLRGAIDHSREQMLLFLGADAPADVTPLPVLLHPTVFNAVKNGGVAGTYGTFANIQSWAQNNAPTVTFVGTGIGTQQYTTSNLPGRDVGRTRWRVTSSNYGGFLGMSDCNTQVPGNTLHPVVGIAPDDIFDVMAPAGGWDNVTAGFDYPDTVHSHAGSGDSGGPVVIGAGPSSKGVSPTPLPAPAAGDSYDTSLGYVAGNANLWISSVGPGPILRPATAYAPTYLEPASQFIAFFMVDDDEDGYANVVDTFPGCDDLGPDTDGDGTPNECDVCPCDTDNNSDGDGFCTIVCPSFVADLCPQVADSPFDNCNEVAEDAHNTSAKADMCDSAICPSTFVPAAAFGPEQKLPCPTRSSDLDQQCPPPGDGVTTWLNCNTYRRDTFDITPLASFGPTGLFTTASSVTTSARFCQQNDALGISCNDPSEDFQDEQVDDFGQAPTADDETKFSHFHRITFSSGGTTDPDVSAPLAYTSLPTSQPSATWKWDFASDQARWLANDQIDLLPGDTPLIGTVWFHTDIPYGGTIDIGRGTHGADLNNWYETGEGTLIGAFSPEAFYCTSCGFLKIPEVFGTGSSSSPSSIEGIGGTASKTPWIVWRTSTSVSPVRAFRRPEASAREASIVWPLENGFGAVGTNCGTGSGSRTGTGQFVNARLGARLHARLANTSLRWFSSVEPASEHGAGASFPMAVALTPNAGFVDTVVSNGAQLLADGDRRVVQPRRVGGPNAPADSYAAVLTRVRRGLFVVTSSPAGSLAGGIWFTPMGSDRWRRIKPRGYTPGKVLAATYSFATDSLYVLDELGGNARLVQMHVRTAAATVLGTWARHADWSRHALVVEESGSLLLASSNPGRRMHIVTRINVKARVGFRDGGGYSRAFQLMTPPVVDPDGYTSLVWTGVKYTRIRERFLRMTRAPGPTGRTDLAEIGLQL